MKSDAELKRDVSAELEWDLEIDHAHIGITANDGAVTLMGYVPTFRQKLAAIEAAERVEGVHAIVDKLEVRIDGIYSTSDEDLAERISHVLRWNVSISSKDIHAEVKNGIVTLSGAVEYFYQKSNIMKNIEHVRGVKNVIDLITIKTHPLKSDVQQKIKSALLRHADVESTNVTVNVRGNTLFLEGRAESIAEKMRIENVAWCTPGVTNVVDNLRIT